jgi:hypothetical protein
MATKSTRYVAEERHEEFDEADHAVYPNAQSEIETSISEPRCVHCGDLLAWHEGPCAVATPPLAEVAAAEINVVISTSTFAYELGHQVLPITGTALRVITWRGQLKERHPESGMVYRVPVYRLNDGYWDCYREEELQVA